MIIGSAVSRMRYCLDCVGVDMVKLFVRDSEDPHMIVWLDETIGRPNWKYNIAWHFDWKKAENCHGQWQVETDGRKLRGKKRTEFVLKWGK